VSNHPERGSHRLRRVVCGIVAVERLPGFEAGQLVDPGFQSLDLGAKLVGIVALGGR
jgi:hypothetical protein